MTTASRRVGAQTHGLSLGARRVGKSAVSVCVYCSVLSAVLQAARSAIKRQTWRSGDSMRPKSSLKVESTRRRTTILATLAYCSTLQLIHTRMAFPQNGRKKEKNDNEDGRKGKIFDGGRALWMDKEKESWARSGPGRTSCATKPDFDEVGSVDRVQRGTEKEEGRSDREGEVGKNTWACRVGRAHRKKKGREQTRSEYWTAAVKGKKAHGVSLKMGAERRR